MTSELQNTIHKKHYFFHLKEIIVEKYIKPRNILMT